MKLTETKIIVTGATGEVGQHASLFLARLGIADYIYLASRDITKSVNILYNSQVNAVMRGNRTIIKPMTIDIQNIPNTVDELNRIKPTLIINFAATMSMYPYFSAMRLRQKKLGILAGFAHTLPKDIAVLWPLMKAVELSDSKPIVINMAAPDIASAIFCSLGLSPDVGAGTLDSTVQGIKINIANYLKLPTERIDVRMITHHAIRRFKAKEVPFILYIYVNGEDYSNRFEQEQIYSFIDNATDITGVETMNTPVTTNAAITAASAVETARCILLDTGEIRHGSGVGGIPGGTPIKLKRRKIDIILPEGVSLENVISVNTAGMKINGVEKIDKNGTVYFTYKERYWLEKGLGLHWKSMKLSDAKEMSSELNSAYKQMKKEEENY